MESEEGVEAPSMADPPTGSGYGYHGHHHKDGAMVTAGSHDVADPVCGMMVDPHLTEHRATFERKLFHFCSAACLGRFEASPASYTS